MHESCFRRPLSPALEWRVRSRGLSRPPTRAQTRLDFAGLSRAEIERHLGMSPAANPDHDEAALPRDRAQRCFGISAATVSKMISAPLPAGEPAANRPESSVA